MLYKNRSFLILLLLSLSFFPVVHSQETAHESIRILVTTESSENDNNSLNEVITNSISIEFQMENFEVVPLAFSDVKKLFNLSRKEDISYMIYSNYYTESGKLYLKMDCLRIMDEQKIFSSSIESAIDLNLDLVIEKSIDDMIEIIQNDMQSNPQLITAITIEEIKEDDEYRHFTLDAGIGLFIPTGSSRDYLTLGIIPELNGTYRFQQNWGYIGLGLFISMNSFTAEGESSSAENLLLSTGPKFIFSFDLNQKISLYADLDGGLTVFLLNRNNEGYQGTIIPCVSSGLGVRFNLINDLAIISSLNYSVYFEKSLFISGFSPALGLYLSL